MKKGKLIVIEGTDGSGKATQALLLKKNLMRLGKKAEIIDFPHYRRNFFGELIGECLRGEYGNFLEIDPRITAVLFGADRWESSEKIKHWLDKGVYVIADRYTSANQLHQGAKIADAKKRKQFAEWIEKMEFDVFKIPKPDAILYLNVPVATTVELIKKRGITQQRKYLDGKKDVHEADIVHQTVAQNQASELFEDRDTWIEIPCMKKGKLMTKKEISDIILNALSVIVGFK